MSFEFFIGFRYLRARRKQAFISVITFISVAGVMLGVMAMMVVLAVMTGFGTDIKSKILGANAHIRVMSRIGKLDQHDEVMAKIEAVEGVRATAPFIYSQVMLRRGSRVSGAVLRGIDPSRAGRVVDLEKSVKETDLRLLGASEVPAGIILGKELSRLLTAYPGDEVYVVSPFGGSLTPVGGRIPHMKKFKVVGLFDSGMYDYDTSFAYVSIESAQRLLRLGQSVHGIEVKVDDIYSVDKISRSVLDRLGTAYWTQDWMQMNKSFFSALKLEKVVMFIILVLIILVAAFNIISTLIMMVMEKTKDIAILKSMGASSKSIMKIFMLNGLVIGVVGTILGIAGGSVLCFLLKRYEFVKLPSDVYYISTLPVRVQVGDVALIALSAIAISFLATLYPSYQASRLDPAAAIRYE
ncbi:MAG: lipoprotein-releasing ABC transporter permease subunit [Deltaproteobacteria bacterium]|nr:lipoprotein-releasing ABC transporter permease subunit [Deltaproteobacteria bacterium]MBW1793933.1 lipoprotein-releasing ABC transporter permease subunit [Deltaproteobacteria bacterium]MBW2330360.1 lipoprotein-releasing ABC transporter permease subunit [Deltaproteobacteria bacterium]